MTGSKIYLDTAPFIYYLEQNQQYFDTTRSFFKKCYEEKIALGAAKIRAKYKGFKALDALHLATAKLSDCNSFITSDKQLRQMQELHILTVDDLK